MLFCYHCPSVALKNTFCLNNKGQKNNLKGGREKSHHWIVLGGVTANELRTNELLSYKPKILKCVKRFLTYKISNHQLLVHVNHCWILQPPPIKCILCTLTLLSKRQQGAGERFWSLDCNPASPLASCEMVSRYRQLPMLQFPQP